LFRAFAWFDRNVVDGAVNGLAWLGVAGGRAARRAQTGQLQLYGIVAFLGMLRWKWDVIPVVIGSGLLGLAYKVGPAAVIWKSHFPSIGSRVVATIQLAGRKTRAARYVCFAPSAVHPGVLQF
jgi:hypothetical protein